MTGRKAVEASMSEMISRVGLALRDKHDPNYEWATLEGWEEIARDAIEAMRESTGVMDGAGAEARDTTDQAIGRASASEAWRLMIDEALRQP